jgi:alkylated DNA repair dioxygenase AlkB
VLQPRLTAAWRDDARLAEHVPVLGEIRRLLSLRYARDFDTGGLNLYRDGRDSVAWHGDRIPKELHEPVVAIVSVGEPRRFLLRPRGGGRSLRFELGAGDLLVTGGRCQREWQHCVPKVAAAGPRISITFRHSS